MSTRVGLVFPTTEIGNDPAAIRDWAQTAEGLGFSHVLSYDHVLLSEHADRDPPLRGPFDERSSFHEPLVLLGYLAAVTRTLELATGVLVLPQRPVALVAKQAAEVDLLSGGRLRLGVGSGWNHPEYEALGESWATRGARFDEQLEVLRLLWGEPLVDYTGRFHRLDRVALVPRPTRQVPVWFGGHSDAALRRAARAGDGLILTPPEVHGQGPELIDSMRAADRAEGRDPSAFGFDAIVRIPEDGWERVVERWREADATYVSLVVSGLSGPSEHIEFLAKAAGAAGLATP